MHQPIRVVENAPSLHASTNKSSGECPLPACIN
jgi:hypothetical protein